MRGNRILPGQSRKRQGGNKTHVGTELHDAVFTQGWAQKVWQGRRGSRVKQFHDLSVFITMDPMKLTREQRATALASLMFLKEKKTGQ
eukprot:CCRYP_015859-RA/>CCRYP_015859-RA protein AED:0.74 eAED:0.43 QI:0/0/0/0.5/0/0/2/0/87